ncbi:hypothetical protein CC78DRAFT_589987, partial [Lojkania enalia]
ANVRALGFSSALATTFGNLLYETFCPTWCQKMKWRKNHSANHNLKTSPTPVPRLRDFILDDNTPISGFPPDNGLIRKSPKVDLGTLDLLPLELL